jgi:preprotein translocase subunit YajC
MFITSAFAQAAAPGGDIFGPGGIIGFMAPMVAIMAVFYFLMIRPQQKKAKEHQDMMSNVSRGDTVVTNGGLIGKVVRVVDDHELLVEVGENVRVRVLRQGLADVRTKGEPMTDEKPTTAPAPKSKKK